MWLAAAALALATLAVAAGLWWSAGRPPLTVGLSSSALTPMPWPDPSGLAPELRDQVASQRDTIERLEGAASRDSAALAAAYGQLGTLLLAGGEGEASAAAAEAALTNAAALASWDARWPYYLGYQSAQARRSEAAAAHFEAALRIDPTSLPAKIHLAEAYHDLGRGEDARAILDEILARDPRFAPAHFLLGQIDSDAGELAAAVTHWEAALEAQPDASIVHRHLATAFRDLGNTAESERHLALRGDIQVALDDPLLFELNALRSAAGALITQGGEAMKAGDTARAADLYAQAVAREPGNAQAQLNLGAALMQLGRKDEAARALAEAVRLDPTDSKAQFNLGLMAQETGQEAQALRAFEAAVAGDPANTRAQLALADGLRLAGRCAEALPHYTRYLADNPTDSRSRRRQALCLAQEGAFADARTLLEAGFAADPTDAVTVDALVRLLAAAPDDAVRDGAQAVRIAEQFAQTSASAEASEILAMAYAEVGRFDEAVRLQEQVIQAFFVDSKRAAMMPFLTMNLEAYQKKQPVRTPFPAFAYSR